MITENYVQAFYRTIYSRLSLCEQDNVRYVYGDWLERLADTVAFCGEMQRACGWLKPVLP